MKKINKHFKYCIIIVLMLVYGNVKAQVNGFTISTPSATNSLGTVFPVNASFNWTPTTTSAVVKINYNPALVSYDATCSAVLPSCMSVTNTGSQLIITMSTLSACTSTGSISFNVCFKFNCPDSCAGVTKASVFTGVLTDNLGTTQNSTCTANGILNNSVSLFQNWYSYNAATAEVTFLVYYQNPNCFKIKHPVFNVVLSPAIGATIEPTPTNTGQNGNTYTYSAVGTTITPSVMEFNQMNQASFLYVVKLPCNTGLGQILTSNISIKGENCGVANSLIAGPAPASFTIPTIPAPNPHISTSSSASSTYFYYTIINDGNTPLNLTATNLLPLVHLQNSPSVTQTSTQSGIVGSVKYFDCSSTSTGPFTLTGSGVTNSGAPTTNTKKVEHTINNLQPGQSVSLTLYYDLTSSCSGTPGSPPYKDILSISYNCIAPPVSCITCGTGVGIKNDTIIYNPQPNIQCVAQPTFSGCKSIGDTLNLCYEFKNVGDAPLIGGVYSVLLPTWLQALYSSVGYTGFSSSPTIATSSNIKFNLPNIPVGTSTYKICFKAVIQSGAVGGTNEFWSGTLAQQYICYTSFNICAFAAIGIDKKVKGNLNTSFANSGTGNPNTAVDYQITLHNTGTIPLDHLEVIDRIPAIGNLSILGSPSSTPIPNQFNMQSVAGFTDPNCTATYTSFQNICTGWPATGVPCNPPIGLGLWGGAIANGGVKFTFNPTYILAPGASYTFTFQTKIPVGTASGLVDCNTAGFIAKSTVPGYTINPDESKPVCIEVVVPEVPPGGCCKDLLKKIKTIQSVSNDILSVNATLTAGPNKLKDVKVSLVNFEVKHPKDCDFCAKNPKVFGNLTNPKSPIGFQNYPAGVPYSHLLQWKDSLGYNFSNGVNLNFEIPLPPRSPIACCCDTIEYCLRYTFTDTACVTCDTTICYKIFNGQNCSNNGTGTSTGDACSCNWKPVLSNSIMHKDMICGGTVSVANGTYSLNPNFQCTPSSQTCTPNKLVVTITNNTTGVTTILTNPNYSYTFLQHTNYTYNLSGNCGGSTCSCRLNIVVD